MTTPRVGALARSASARADDVRAASRLRSAACSTSRPQQPLPPARRIHPTRASSAARTAGSTRTTCDDAESPPLAPPAEDEAPEVTSRRLAEEALASAVEFESLWVSDSSVRGKINGEEAAARARAASGANTPRRRRGYQPTASDIERDELAASTAADAAHPAAALFEDPDFRLAKVASLYRFLKPAVTPRDVPNGCGDGGGVARALAARPAALHDLTPRDAARLLVHLRQKHGDAADLVDVVAAKDFEALLAPPPDRDDSDAAREARARARRLEAMAAAGGAMRTVTARVEARVRASASPPPRASTAAAARGAKPAAASSAPDARTLARYSRGSEGLSATAARGSADVGAAADAKAATKAAKSVYEATPTPTPVAAAVAAAAAAAAAAMDAAAAADESGGVADAVYAEAYLDEAARAGLSSDDTPSARFDAEVGEYSRESARLADEL